MSHCRFFVKNKALQPTVSLFTLRVHSMKRHLSIYWTRRALSIYNIDSVPFNVIFTMVIRTQRSFYGKSKLQWIV